MNEIIVLKDSEVSRIEALDLEQRFTNTLTDSTNRAYMSDIKEFFKVFSINQINFDRIKEVDVNTANKYFEILVKKGLKISTINRKMTSLSFFFSFLSRRDIGIVQYNPFSPKEGCRRYKNGRNYSTTRCLTTSEVKQLIGATNEDSIIDMRDKLIIMLLSTTGMRREEIVSIKIGDIFKNSGKNCAEIIGKGDKSRYIVFAPIVFEMIEKYLEYRGLTFEDKDEFLIVNHARNYDNKQLSTISIYNIIKKHSSMAGINPESISPHSLRHSFITISLENGAKIEDVQDMVGHASMNTTRRYDHTNRVIMNNTSEKLSNLFV